MLPKIEVPAELRALAAKSIDQAEQAFSLFFAAANRSLRAMRSDGREAQFAISWPVVEQLICNGKLWTVVCGRLFG
jgi:hypothetical protein